MLGELAITNALNHWLEKYGFECRVSKLGTDFCWWHDSDTIEYALVVADAWTPIWEKLMVEQGLKYNIDIFFTSFLHEAFHSETFHFLEDEEIDYSHMIMDSLQGDNDEDNWTYFHLPSEIIATKGAVDYINANPNAVAELVGAVSPLIKKFFELNNGEE